MLRETHVADLADVATKADLRAVEAALRADLRGVEAELKTDPRDLRADLRTVEASLKGEPTAQRGEMNAKIADGGRTTLQWAVGLFVAQTALIVGLIELMN
jgi:hypothetical protein